MKPFDRIIVVTLANQSPNNVLENSFFQKLAKAGAYLKNYFGVYHPAQPNHLALFAGETCGITNNLIYTNPFKQQTIVDLLEAKGVSWKSYVEDIPDQPWNPVWETPQYDAKQIPFATTPMKSKEETPSYFRYNNVLASFHNIQKSEQRWKKLVNENQFWEDIHQNQLPECVWYIPNIWNRGDFLSDSLKTPNLRAEVISQQSMWLEQMFLGNTNSTGLNLDIDLLLENPKDAYENSNIPKGTLLVITFDESNDNTNHVYAVLLGDMIQPGTVIETPFNHYSLLKTIEENFQLGTLNKNDKYASWFQFLRNKSFSWNTTASNTGFEAGIALAMTGNHLIFSDKEGDLFESFQTDSKWSQPKTLDIFTNYPVSLATIGETTFLVYKQANNDLLYKTYNTQSKEWSSMPIQLGFPSKGDFDLISYTDDSTQEEKLMLCWIGSQKEIHYMFGVEHGFDHMIYRTHQQTDGSIKLGQLGASLFLVYKEINTEKMRMTSFNTAEYNEVLALDLQGTPAEENNATRNVWSIFDYEVRGFSKDQISTYRNSGSIALASADGHLHIVYSNDQESSRKTMTSLFGFTGVLTPQDRATNGHGTLVELGWTEEKEMPQITFDENSPIAMTSNGKKLTLVWIDTKSGTIQSLQGGYQ